MVDFQLETRDKMWFLEPRTVPFAASDPTGFLFHARDLEEIAAGMHPIQLDIVLALLLMQSFLLLSSHLWINVGFC